MSAGLPTLAGSQERASRPTQDMWLSASAGTGKTQVLAARVYRLLLAGNAPEAILALTFTKAGAAEMAERIHTQLGAWVTMKDTEIASDLKALGENHGPDQVRRARTLFAKVLDARGGGLRIQTIHGFCQSLLGSFPAEAGLTPGFRAIEGREQAELHDRALALWIDAASDADRAHLTRLSLVLGDGPAKAHLQRCASAADAMAALGSDIGPRLRWWFGLDPENSQKAVDEAIDDKAIPLATLKSALLRLREWGTPTGQKSADAIQAWLDADHHGRLAHIDGLREVWRKKTDGQPKAIPKNLEGTDYPAIVAILYDYFEAVCDLIKRIAIADLYTAALIVGQHYAAHYDTIKRSEGVVDFDDLIARTAALLTHNGMGAWVRYKLDQGLDHLLIDEAQDTNAQQWAIIEALTDEFYAGAGARDDRIRTLFTVGDYKQAIFGFQGTDPRQFRDARRHFAARIAAADRELGNEALSDSFRSSQPVLDVVDGVITDLGIEAFGLDEPVNRHTSYGSSKPSGQVVVWPAFAADDADGDTESDEDEETWATAIERDYARNLAETVKHWLNGGLFLENKGRAVRPEDIMILLRSRSDLAQLIVARLYEAKVPVAGVDRLRLTSPIAVQDLLAAIRFVLQPADDLNLAALLVSPLIGWDQDQLWQAGRKRPKGLSLWRHISDNRPQALLDMLKMADTTTPYRFLETILSGPIAGRAKLLRQLGEEARDPIEALLNEALAFERTAQPSLQLFIDWFDRGDVDIKRDAAKADAAVRVMTVHGAKGLQAPVVVLADATFLPDKQPKPGIHWDRGDESVPLFRPRADLRAGPLVQAVADADAREREEHWRLLYVAMTRAEEHLFVGGVAKQMKDGVPNPDSWHAATTRALADIGADSDDDGTLIFRKTGKRAAPENKTDAEPRWTGDLPDWLQTPAPPEARPPRPLAPSAAEARDDVADPPPSPEQQAAALRGQWLHTLFERLPATPPAQREVAAHRWLEGVAGVADQAVRTTLVDAGLSVINAPQFAALFSDAALAEVPLAGVVEGRVIAGTADRLLITDTSVLVVDFKTGRRVPQSVAAVPEAHKAQMAAYAAVLRGMFPGRSVAAALLYTAGPALITLPQNVLDAHKPGYRDQQELLQTGG